MERLECALCSQARSLEASMAAEGTSDEKVEEQESHDSEPLFAPGMSLAARLAELERYGMFSTSSDFPMLDWRRKRARDQKKT